MGCCESQYVKRTDHSHSRCKLCQQRTKTRKTSFSNYSDYPNYSQYSLPLYDGDYPIQTEFSDRQNQCEWMDISVLQSWPQEKQKKYFDWYQKEFFPVFRAMGETKQTISLFDTSNRSLPEPSILEERTPAGSKKSNYKQTYSYVIDDNKTRK